MVCPSCGYTWDKSKRSCQQCGFRMDATTQSASTTEPEEIWRSMTQSGNFIQTEAAADALAANQRRKSVSAPLRSQSGGLVEARRTTEPVSGSLMRKNAPGSSSLAMTAGAHLRNGRYRLQEPLKRQVWGAGAFEATWIGRDLQQEKQVMICEVVVPEQYSAQTLSIMHAATTSLLSVRQSAHLTPILDAFRDQERSFFVFAPPAGETLEAKLRREQRPFSEQAIIDFCLQMVDILETFSRKSPPLVHGLICPEHVLISYDGARYILSNFSIFAAGSATSILAGIERARLSPYMAPEFAHDDFDSRYDLYAVIATAYFLATGKPPMANASPRVRSINPEISLALDAILAKGLRAIPQQRYQRPSQLRQDLLDLRTQKAREEMPLPARAPRIPPAFPGNAYTPTPAPAGGDGIPPLPIALLAPTEEQDVLLPAPETLPPLSMGGERLEAGIMLAILLAGLGIITGLSHFHV
jgi:serine/threonine protein kinase